MPPHPIRPTGVQHYAVIANASVNLKPVTSTHCVRNPDLQKRENVCEDKRRPIFMNIGIKLVAKLMLLFRPLVIQQEGPWRRNRV